MAEEEERERFVILSGADATGMPTAPSIVLGDLAAFRLDAPPGAPRATYYGGRGSPDKPRQAWPRPIELYAPEYVHSATIDAFARKLAVMLGFLAAAR